jgi:tetratricopeptide (TPR) repeat protein
VTILSLVCSIEIAGITVLATLIGGGTGRSSDPAVPLRRAILDFSQGRTEAARATCRDLLRIAPENPGALHLLGLIAHRDGHQGEALELLRRAAASPEATALHLMSYADLCRKAGDHDTALHAARRAVNLDATMALGWFCLGNVLCEMHQYHECRGCFERALERDPHLREARTSLAGVLARLGEVPAAIGQFERLLAEEPDNAECHGNYAVLLQELGRYEDALAQAERAVSQQPNVLTHHLRAAAIEMQLGRHGPALARLDVVEKALLDRSRPDRARLLALKAHLLKLVDRYDEAVALCRDALANGVESSDLLHVYGLALQAARAESAALGLFDRAAAVATDPAAALSDKAVLLTQLGRLPEACQTFDQALAVAPTLADAWYNKTNAKTYAPDDPDIAAIERLLGGYCIYRDRILLHFALGKAYMDTGQADAAFRHWHAGNRLKRAIVDYDADAMAVRMASIAARPTHFGTLRRTSDAATNAHLSELPVFIVGMPRSGSSLVEQILASHPEVHGAGESSGLRALFEEQELTNPDDPAAAAAEDRIATAVLARLRRFSAQANRVVDKDLRNFLHLDTIHRIFPRARIIHCRRDPLDTCFSAYTKLFLGDLHFTYDLGELGRYFLNYHALMRHWRSVLPREVFLEIDYETLVLQPQAETRRLLGFLGLPWNEACLRFFENRRPISTASVTQVRRPIYRSSVGRASSLKHHLQPLIPVLGDLAL